MPLATCLLTRTCPYFSPVHFTIRIFPFSLPSSLSSPFPTPTPKLSPSPSFSPPFLRIMLVGDHSNSPAASFSPSASQPSAPVLASTHRHYIPSLIPPGVDPAKVDSKMFYTYVPNTIKTRKRTTPAQLEILEGVFVTDKKPNAPKRKDLAKKLKMSPREVQVCVSLPAPHTLFFPSSTRVFPHISPSLPFSTPEYLTSSRFTKRCGSKIGAQRKRRPSPKRTHHPPPPPPPLA